MPHENRLLIIYQQAIHYYLVPFDAYRLIALQISNIKSSQELIRSRNDLIQSARSIAHPGHHAAYVDKLTECIM